MAKTIIDLKKADLTLGQAAASVHVLKGIDLEVRDGELIALLRTANDAKSGKHQRHDTGCDGQSHQEFEEREPPHTFLNGAVHGAGR